MKFQIHYPTKPYIITQQWGIKNDFYKQFGFGSHNGIDTRLGLDKKEYCPFPHKATVVRVGNQPNGGGIFVGVCSNEEYLFPDGKLASVLIDSLHMESISVNEGDEVNTGDLLGIQDNSGLATSGPHTHRQFRRVKVISLNPFRFVEVDKNDANNSFDPTSYWSGEYAQDMKKIEDQLSFIQKIINLWQKRFSK